MENQFKSTHNLDFLTTEHPILSFPLFKVGTCDGMWAPLPDSYVIVSVINSDPGNGHLTDVFEWFENSCKRDNKNLLIVEIMNESFKNHLIFKRGFLPLNDRGDNVIKIFNRKKYRDLLKNGNEIIQAGTMKCV